MFLLGIAYSASIGGCGTLIGTGTNMTFKGIYESMFPAAPEIEFAPFLLYSGPISIVMGICVWLLMNMLYTGLFCTKCLGHNDMVMTAEAETTAKGVIRQNVKDLGPMSVREILVTVLFVIAVIVWFFRTPGFMKGWPVLFTKLKITDATATSAIIFVLVVLPADWSCLQFFSKTDRKIKNSESLLPWDVIEKNIPWSLLFLIGSGFVLAEAGKISGMSALIGSWLVRLKSLPSLVLTFIVCIACQLLTEISSNVAISNILLPILGEMAIQTNIHPLKLMLPAALSCSYAFMLPVGTPPNAFVSGVGHIRTSQMVK